MNGLWMTLPPEVGHSRRSTPAFSVGGLGFEPFASRPDQGYNFIPYGGWVCFQCGDRFTDMRSARRHFGHKYTTPPACTAAEDAIPFVEWSKGVAVNIERDDAI